MPIHPTRAVACSLLLGYFATGGGVDAASDPTNGTVSRQVTPAATLGSSQESVVGASGSENAPETAGPLSLDAAVLQALRQSPTLEIARRERNVGLIDADRNRPVFRPEVNAVGSQVFRTPRVDLPGRPDEVVLPNSISRLAIELRQPIYQFGVGDAPGRRAEAMEGAARSEYRAAELDTVLQAREAYLTALRTQALVDIARRGKVLADENARLTDLLVKQGLQAEVDLLEARRAAAEAESGVVQAENGAALARANLNRVMGRPVDAALLLTAAGDLPPEPETLEALSERAFRQRPELEQLRQNIEAAEAGIRLARAARQPRVSVEAAYALQTETALVPRSGLSAGVSISVPIFSGAVNRYTVREAEERLAQLKSALTAREQGVQLEIEQQRLSLREARQRIALAERAVEAAEKALEIVRLRLERGRAVQVEVLNARLSLVRALTDRAGAVLDLHLAQARLSRALGEGPTLEPAPDGERQNDPERHPGPNDRK